MWPGFDSRTRSHTWGELVVDCCPCSKGFSPGSSLFLPPQKSTLLNFNSISKQWMKSHFLEIPLQIPIYFFFLFYTFTFSWLTAWLSSAFVFANFFFWNVIANQWSYDGGGEMRDNLNLSSSLTITNIRRRANQMSTFHPARDCKIYKI